MEECCTGRTKLSRTLWKVIAILGLVAVAAFYAKGSLAQDSPQPKISVPTKIKIPHNHASRHGGTVIMVGDDHFEFSPLSGKPHTVRAYITDKFRDPVPQNLFKIEVSLLEGDKRIPLATRGTSEDSASFILELPPGTNPGATLELRAPRITPVKGQVTTANPQTVKLTGLLGSGHQADHSMMEMGK